MMKNLGPVSARMARVNWLPHHKFIVEYAPRRVWPLILNWPQWISDYRVGHVAGEPDSIGEVKSVSKIGADGSVQGNFLVEIVRLTPYERVVYRILPLQTPAFGVEQIRGFEIFSLYDLGSKTLVTYETVAEMETSLMSQKDFDAAWPASDSPSAEWMQRYVPELKRLLAITTREAGL